MPISTDEPLPSLRPDLELYEVMPGLLELYDTAGYTDVTVRLPVELISLLLEADGRRSLDEIVAENVTERATIDRERLVEVIEMLDDEGFLMTSRFYDRRRTIHAEYNRLPIRPPAFAGASYPDDPQELREEIEGFLERGGRIVAEREAERGAMPATVPDGLFIPHIDPRVGGDLYGAAYSQIVDSEADTFMILGVPHTMRNDRLMFSRMDFDTPIGRVETDRELIEAIAEEVTPIFGRPPTLDESPHMMEHSIEFQTIFLQHLFGDRPFRIVPILLDSLAPWVESGQGGIEEEKGWSGIYRALREVPERLGRNVCVIASVDFCHIGRKFGDDRAAATMVEEIELHDRRLIEAAEAGDHAGFISYLTAISNRYRVCGVSPMYAMMRMMPECRGRLLGRDFWDEEERESGVSFASVRFDRPVEGQ